LQVESFFLARARWAGHILLSSSLLVLLSGCQVLSGCHRTPPTDVVATVNGKDILRSELERKYQIWKISQGESPQQPSAEQSDLARLALLRQMIIEEILQQRAAKLGVAASDEDVNAALTEKKLPFTQEEFDAQLKQHNETLEEYRNDLRRSLTENKLLNKEIDSKINITDAEITSYYAAHKADFNLIEPKYVLARVAVSIAPTGQTNNLQNNKASGDADARNKIQLLYKKLENGEDFGAIAMNYSEDKDTASNGGEMGVVPESDLHRAASPEVYDAITQLKPGQFTGILPMYGGPDPAGHKPVGFAIYKLISKEAAGQRTLNDVNVQQTIRQQLREGHAQLLKTAYYEKIGDDAKVQNYLADQILAGAK
jgi:peptidyl-prolyl cis-trans isomerase SurA